MKKYFILLFALFVGIASAQRRRSYAKQDYAEMFKKISDEILLNSNSYENLYELCKKVGPRFAASPGYDKAVSWAEEKLKKVGAEKIYRQKVVVPVWNRGKQSLKIKAKNGNWSELNTLTLGGSVGTEGKEISGEILYAENINEFNKMFTKDVSGKIVFFNYAFDQTKINPVDAYQEAGRYRWSTPSITARKDAIAVITRSATSAFDDVPHTGSLYYDPEEKTKIPAFTLGAQTADQLEELVKKGKVQAKISTTSGTNGVDIDYNVIGEIPGHKDGKVILVGAHLDTWDITEGAHDNGAGVVQCLEVLRALKAINYKNNHTIRVVLFANEENGVTGGNTYYEEIKKSNEPHIFAIESDAGGYAPRGISLDMIPLRRRLVFDWKDYFLPYGVYNFDEEYAGQDIQPLKKLGVPLAELVPDMQRYFDIHHTKNDTFDKVNRRELMLGAITIAQMVYMVDQNW